MKDGHLVLGIKFHWNTATPSCFDAIYGYNGRLKQLKQRLYGSQSPKYCLPVPLQVRCADP